MGWSIAMLENTVKVPAKAQKDLKKLDDGHVFEYDDCGALGGKLEFNSDHMEHMDYLHHDGVIETLIKHKAKGRVMFGDLDGDNFGSFWGYEFVDGACHRLTGELVWKRA